MKQKENMIINTPYRIDTDWDKVSYEDRQKEWDLQEKQEKRVIKNVKEMSDDLSDMFLNEVKACMMLLAGAKPNCSTFIDEVSVTYGFGELDDIGSWEYQIPIQKVYQKLFMKKTEKWDDKKVEECNNFFLGLSNENFRSLIVDYLNS